jgi:hypothetical protein
MGFNKSLIIAIITCFIINTSLCQKIAVDKWKYIQVDNDRAKWGDFDKPDWLRYYGTDARDINNDGYKDIVAGRYVYINPKEDMTGKWKRIDFGENIDGLLWIDADGDDLPDIFAEALPNVYWLEASDKTFTKWNKVKIAHIKETDHVNGQGFEYKQVIAGGKPEILMNSGEGLFMIQIPESNAQGGNWKTTLISNEETNDEGITVGDMDGDGDTDIISSRNNGKGAKSYVWYANPGNGNETTDKWVEHLISTVTFWPDRVEVADLNGDGLLDVIGSEERWPGLKPDASIYWFEQIRDLNCTLFKQHVLKTTWSMNNLDIADLDKDGDIDIITNEHKGSDFNTYLFVNDGKGRFTENTIDKGHEHHIGTQFFDLDNDGDFDVLGAAWDEYKPLHLMRNDAMKKVEVNKPEKMGSVMITEVTDKNIDAFKIETKIGTYIYQKVAGGLSSFIDKDGQDWIAWKEMGPDVYPQSLTGDFRGIPNAIANGTTHPGFDKCVSVQLNANTIESTSKDGLWKYRWEFYDDYAKMTWLQVAPDQKYYMLYEGPIDGFYDPKNQLWGNDKNGTRSDKPKLGVKEDNLAVDDWDYVYFGSKNGKETLYFTTGSGPDKLPDMVAFADNDFKKPTDGMMVFGFGRGRNTSRHYSSPMTFYMGFVNENIRSKGLKERIKMKVDEIRK